MMNTTDVMEHIARYGHKHIFTGLFYTAAGFARDFISLYMCAPVRIRALALMSNTDNFERSMSIIFV